MANKGNKKIYDIIVFIAVVLSLVFTSITVSSRMVSSNNQKVGILGDDPNIDAKENYRIMSVLADDVCDDCDDDDDGPGINKKPNAYIYQIEPNPAGEFDPVYFEGYGEDTDGGTIEGYRWNSSIDGILSTESSFTKSDLSPGTHNITFIVMDNGNLESKADYLYLDIIANMPPDAPIITGGNIKPDEEVIFSFKTTDPENDKLNLYVDWGDESEKDWGEDTYLSNEKVDISHTYEGKGPYTIKAQAKDIHGEKGEFGSKTVQTSKSRQYNNLLIQKFMNKIFDFLFDISNLLFTLS